MQTYSHFIITTALNRGLKNKEQTGSDGEATGATDNLPPAHTFAFLFGSIAPDLPLIILGIVFIASDILAGRSIDPGNEAVQSNASYLFDTLFYHDPWVKAAHNIFHAPFVVAVLVALGYWAWRRGKKWGIPLFWFGLACAIHTAIDIPTHYNDGPLIFFPFDWETRFYSPLSYWDPSRGGIWFAIFEHLLVLSLLVWMLIDWRRRKRRQTAPQGAD